MRHRIVMESVPIFVLEVPRRETVLPALDAVVAHFKARIDAHPCARFLGIFDHFAHTTGLGEGEIAEGILDARCVMFCFGMTIPSPEALALRPRSIGIAELAEMFVISFLETPMPRANSAMESWAWQVLAEPPAGRSMASETTRVVTAPRIC